MLHASDLERLAAIARERNLWVISDEAYEDVVFDGEHVSIASLPGMYERTIPLYTFSKSYAMTGLRLGYVAIKDAAIRDRAKKVLFYTASNVASVVQFGGIGALEGPQDCIEDVPRGAARAARPVLSAASRAGRRHLLGQAAGRGVLRVPAHRSATGRDGRRQRRRSLSWRMVEYLIKHGRIGCVPGVDFGANGEGYVRFCFARDRKELTGALESMKELFGVADAGAALRAGSQKDPAP